jgi:hypothetical protein
MMWIVLAATPLTAARTVSHLRLMRPLALPSITYSGSPKGRVSVVMQEKSVATTATTLPQGLPQGPPQTTETTAATASSENPFNVIRLLRQHWSFSLAVLAGCLFARDTTSTISGLVQVGTGFVKSHYKGLIALVSGHDLLMRFGVYRMIPKIFGVASNVDMKAGLTYINATLAALQEALSPQRDGEPVKIDSPEDVEAMLWKDTFDRATFAVTQSTVQYDIVVLDQDGKQPLHKKLPKALRCVLTLLQPAAQGEQTSLVLEARTNDQSHILVRHMDVTNTILGQLKHLSGKPAGHALPRFSLLMKGNDFRESGRYELSVP